MEFEISQLGLPQSLLSQFPGPVMFGRWNFYNARSGTTALYSPLGRSRSINITNSYNISSYLTKIVGAHTLKLGVDIRRNHWIQQNSGDILQFRSPRASRTISTGTFCC